MKIDLSLEGIEHLSAHSSLPSSLYEDLTLPSSFGTITSPEDGYIIIVGVVNSGATRGNIVLEQVINGELVIRVSNTVTVPGLGIDAFLPTKKGEVVKVSYDNNNVTISYFRFVYCVGSTTA